MSTSAKDWGIYLAVTVLFATCVFCDLRLLIWWFCRLVMLACILMLSAYLLSPVWKRIQDCWERMRPKKTDPDNGFSEDELETRRQEARHRSHMLHKYKLESYTERVLRPREEARKRRQEAEHQRSTGVSSTGHKLGGVKGGSAANGNSATAAMVRRLPGNAHNPTTSSSVLTTTRKKTKKKLVLRDEPPEGAEGSLTVVFRTPQGRTHKRRVLATDTVQVLLDFMTSIGYHQKLYSLALSYPRRVISRDVTAELRDVTIDRDTTLNIEEKETATEESDSH